MVEGAVGRRYWSRRLFRQHVACWPRGVRPPPQGMGWPFLTHCVQRPGTICCRVHRRRRFSLASFRARHATAPFAGRMRGSRPSLSSFAVHVVTRTTAMVITVTYRTTKMVSNRPWYFPVAPSSPRRVFTVWTDGSGKRYRRQQPEQT